jgi:hypothetical protein
MLYNSFVYSFRQAATAAEVAKAANIAASAKGFTPYNFIYLFTPFFCLPILTLLLFKTKTKMPLTRLFTPRNQCKPHR